MSQGSDGRRSSPAGVRPGLSDDQRAIADTVVQLLAELSGEADVRTAIAGEDGVDPKLWQALVELGVPAMAVAEEDGGLGLGITELSLVTEAAGATLTCAPLFSSVVLAGTVLGELAAAGRGERRGADAVRTEAVRALLAASAAGERRLAWVSGPTDRGRQDPVGRAGEGPAGWSVTGRAPQVVDGHTAEWLVVLADSDAGPALLAVDASGPGVARRRLATLDLTRPRACVDLDAASATLLAQGHAVPGLLAGALDVARVLLAAEQLGLAQRCLDVAVDYARTREQFGRVIGSFQAVKHTCAEMLIRVEAARATVVGAVSAADDPDRSRLGEAAGLAAIVASEAAFANASDALHVHGGIGFTWEHASHLYFRRAKADQLELGTPAEHRERLIGLAGLAEAVVA